MPREVIFSAFVLLTIIATLFFIGLMQKDMAPLLWHQWQAGHRSSQMWELLLEDWCVKGAQFNSNCWSFKVSNSHSTESSDASN